MLVRARVDLARGLDKAKGANGCAYHQGECDQEEITAAESVDGVEAKKLFSTRQEMRKGLNGGAHAGMAKSQFTIPVPMATRRA